MPDSASWPRIDGPLDETVPARRPVTIEDLLTFRMGFGLITEPEFDPPYPINRAADDLRLVLGEPDPRTPHDPDEWIRRFGSLPLMYQPGERWSYNTGTLVLGVLLARAAGRPLGDLLRERLFEPLGMAETGFSLPPERARQLPAHYMTDSRDRADDRTYRHRPGDLEPPAGLPVRIRRARVHGGRVPTRSPACCSTAACTAVPGCCRRSRWSC